MAQVITSITTTSDAGRKITVMVAVGEQEEYATKLHFLGEVSNKGDHYAISGWTWVREGRDEPDCIVHRLDTNEELNAEAKLDIMYAICITMDEEQHGIMEQEMNRICGEE